jgi:hypothetical protein
MPTVTVRFSKGMGAAERAANGAHSGAAKPSTLA